ncbi:unnamed protein product [Rotaria sordida]|uniref:Uncharacterized protein n=1 Tax=Rotaria sordida TaxID=392033 RepID=A0A815S539_9BILA|nr:unnamed protein product [Rotaria sordida]
MRDTISVTSSTQNKINKRREKSKKSSQSRINKLKLLSIDGRSGGGGGDERISIDNNHFKYEQAQKAIPFLAQAFANGFFTEVNCRILPEHLLDQLAQQVYQFVQKQGELNCSLILNKYVEENLLNEYVNKIYVGDFEENKIEKKEINSMHIILYKTKDDNPSNHEVSIEGEKQNLACRWSLPHYQFESLWETVQFDLPLKSQLMQYVFTLIRFYKANIDRTLIHCNQTILLYGPPEFIRNKHILIERKENYHKWEDFILYWFLFLFKIVLKDLTS